jgi:hypothetical protein
MKKLDHWVPMKLTYLGDVRSLLRTGGGKLSVMLADGGDPPRKPKGQG